MLRITHTQVALGPHHITDIDDGLTRQTSKRGTGDPKRVQRDGNSLSGPDKSTKPGVNYLKQKCYLPRVKAGETSVAGYIDIKETDRVLMSQGKGCINGLRVAGHVTVTSFTAADVAAPTLSVADLGTPGAGDLTLTGTNMTSLAPDITSVILTGTGAVTLTQTQITTGGGTVSATSIFIPAALITGAVVTATSAKVRADGQLSSVVVLT